MMIGPCDVQGCSFGNSVRYLSELGSKSFFSLTCNVFSMSFFLCMFEVFTLGYVCTRHALN